MRNQTIFLASILLCMSGITGCQDASPAVWHRMLPDMWAIVAAYDGRMFLSGLPLNPIKPGLDLESCHSAMRPDGQQMAIANTYQGPLVSSEFVHEVSVWDLKTRKVCKTMTGEAVLFSRDNKWLVVKDREREKLCKYDTNNYTACAVEINNPWLQQLTAMSADGSRMCDDGSLIVIDENGKDSKRWDGNSFIYYGQWRTELTDIHPETLYVAHKLGGEDSVVVFDSASKEPKLTRLKLSDEDKKQTKGIVAVKYNPLQGSEEVLAAYQDGSLRVWGVSPQALQQETILPTRRGKLTIVTDRKDILFNEEEQRDVSLNSVRFSGNGQMIAFTDSSGLLTICDAVTLKSIQCWGVKNKRITDVQLSDHGERILTVAEELDDVNTHLWERITADQLKPYLE